MIPDAFPDSIRGINKLPEDEKLAIYSTLLPEWVFLDFGIDPTTGQFQGQDAVYVTGYPNSRAVEVTVRRQGKDRDPLMYINMADTFNNQLLVLLVVVNDPESPRFDIDVDMQGNNTQFGTSGRNLPAERAAMDAGLAPGQVRRGLRAFKRSVPLFEEFVTRMAR